LVFAKEKDRDLHAEDGYLHTYEIYGLNLQAELAILSACETAAGDLVDGEGVLSIAHAFQYAGCPSMVTSLWQVDEKASAQILELFYDNLSKNWNKARALREAKLEYLKRQKTTQLKAPYYWAGLVLVGDDQPIFLASPGQGMLFIFLGILMIIILLVFYRKMWLAKRRDI
jgi:CHAT domain-containing protein